MRGSGHRRRKSCAVLVYKDAPAEAASCADADSEKPCSSATAISKLQRAVVVGAGPAGATAAIYLARRGFSVDVYERRPEPQEDQVDKRRSYIIALTERGMHAIESAGVRVPPLGDGGGYLGAVTHPARGKPRVGSAEGSTSFERVELAQLLIDEARRLDIGGRTRFHFQAPLQSMDLERRVARFGTADGGATEVEYDLLVGADGANSVVRMELMRSNPAMQVSEEDSGREYKTWKGLPAPPGLEPEQFRGKPGRTLHLFLGNNTLSSVSAHRNVDGTYSGTMALRNGEFNKLRSAADYERLIAEQVPGVPMEWRRPIGEQCMEAPVSSTGKRVRCSQLHGNRVVLLGDAAHAVTPVGGQGANAALQDCEVLDRVLAECGNDVEAAAERWTEARGPDARALADIEASFYKLVGGRRLGFLDPGFLRLIAHIALGTVVYTVFKPLGAQPPALARLGSQMPYSQINAQITRDALVAAALVAALFAYGAVKLVSVL